MGLNKESKDAGDQKYILPRVIRVIPERRGIYVVKNPSSEAYRLDFGVSPFGPPPEYYSMLEEICQSGELAEASLTYDVDASPATNFVRKRFGIGISPYVAFSSGGSDEILERTITQLIRNRSITGVTKIVGTQPQYPHILNFTDRHIIYDNVGTPQKGQKVHYEAFETNLHTPFDEVVREFADNYHRPKSRLHPNPYRPKSRENIIFYICNPNSPTGDLASFNTLNYLADLCSQREQRLLIVDEAFGDAVEDENSTIPLTEKYPNIIVLRSLSKIIGLPGLRVGYAVMSEQVGQQYENVRRVCDLAGPTQLIVNKILVPDIMERHLKNVREKTVEVKTELLTQLDHSSIRYSPTDLRVPILYIDGGDQYFYERLREQLVETTSGFTFSSVRRDDLQKYGSIEMYRDLYKGRWVRMVIPKQLEDIPEIIKRLRMALINGYR